jgi:uncharacterized protein (TIGR02145 family)
MYRVYAFNNAGNSAQYSNEFQVTTYAVPTLTTNSITSITGDLAISGGNITSSGGAAVYGSGVCWSTSANPTIALSTITYDYLDIGQDGFTSYIYGLTPNTTYHVRAYATNTVGTAYGADSVFTTLQSFLPTVTTDSVRTVYNNTAICFGNVTNDGNTRVAARGFCWSTSPNPTIALSTKTINRYGTGEFVSSITGLTTNTTYYVRAYATNYIGTSYGTQQTFTTTNIPFVNIPSITIGTQVWTTKNLNVVNYHNGELIPEVTDPTEWANLTTGAWCWYNNDSATYAATYGRLYNWYAVNDPRGFAPQGWHVPSDYEWRTLTDFLGGENVAGGKMKSTTLWNSPNTDATNSSGFSGLPGGFRDYGVAFYDVGYYGYWWSASAFDTTYAWLRALGYDDSNVYRYPSDKTNGFSVRVVRD